MNNVIVSQTTHNKYRKEYIKNQVIFFFINSTILCLLFIKRLIRLNYVKKNVLKSINVDGCLGI